MIRILRVLLLTASVLVFGLSAVAVAQATKADMVSKSANHNWVHRRNENDRANKPDPNGALAMVIHLNHAGTHTTGDPMVSGTMTIWTTVAGTKYGGKRVYDLPAVRVHNGGQDARKREFCRWENTTAATSNPAGTLPNLHVYASLYSGKDKKNDTGRDRKRFVVRYRDLGVKAAGCEGGALQEAGGCDEEPDEDVLDEETGVNPNDMPYDP